MKTTVWRSNRSQIRWSWVEMVSKRAFTINIIISSVYLPDSQEYCIGLLFVMVHFYNFFFSLFSNATHFFSKWSAVKFIMYCALFRYVYLIIVLIGYLMKSEKNNSILSIILYLTLYYCVVHYVKDEYLNFNEANTYTHTHTHTYPQCIILLYKGLKLSQTPS